MCEAGYGVQLARIADMLGLGCLSFRRDIG
jgi:hypothetical protein